MRVDWRISIYTMFKLPTLVGCAKQKHMESWCLLVFFGTFWIFTKISFALFYICYQAF